jgi:hypothetical protein
MAADPLDQEVAALRERAERSAPKYVEVTLSSFLEETPPDGYVTVIDLKASSSDSKYIEMPDIVHYCEHERCGGPRNFKPDRNLPASTSWSFVYSVYTCRNCGSRVVRFAISYYAKVVPTPSSLGTGVFNKIGQVPAFGPPTPSRLITLIGPDRELFLQGRRAENRGLGIGAFAYYRRVVENQKNRIIGEIAKVAKQLGSSPETNALFLAAINETRFSESIAKVKDAIPQALLIGGHNPLILLHSALSKGLHNPEMTDAHCLQLAQSIRTILAELAERSSEALKNDKEIQSALSTLLAVPSGLRQLP